MRGLKTSLAIFAIAVLIWAGWAIIVLGYKAGLLPFFGPQEGSLELAGQFGDAFGALASFMAALAAAAALSAFLRQRSEMASQEFERNFYSLLSNLQLQIAETDIKRFDPADVRQLRRSFAEHKHADIHLQDQRAFLIPLTEIKGRDAFRALLNRLRKYIENPNRFADSKSIHRKYNVFYDQWHDDLGHYFRTLYHIFRVIDEECPGDKMRYARIVRAHLSSSEIVLLAYNCSVGEGRHKFKRYVEEFALLHNYHLRLGSEFYVREREFFERMLGANPFGNQTEQPFEYS